MPMFSPYPPINSLLDVHIYIFLVSIIFFFYLVGSPIHLEKVENPTQEEIDAIHKKYVDSLVKLFYTYRDKYADPKAELTIL